MLVLYMAVLRGFLLWVQSCFCWCSVDYILLGGAQLQSMSIKICFRPLSFPHSPYHPPEFLIAKCVNILRKKIWKATNKQTNRLTAKWQFCFRKGGFLLNWKNERSSFLKLWHVFAIICSVRIFLNSIKSFLLK